MDCNCGCQSRVLVATSRGRKQSRKVQKYSCKLRGTTGPARTQCFPLLSQRPWTWQQDRGPAKSVWHWQGIAQCFHQVLDPGWEALELAAERESVCRWPGDRLLVGPPPTQYFHVFSPKYWTWQQNPWTMSCISSHLEAMAYADRVSFWNMFDLKMMLCEFKFSPGLQGWTLDSGSRHVRNVGCV